MSDEMMYEILNILIGGEQKHQSVKIDGICTCLCSSMGTGGVHTYGSNDWER